MAFEAGAIVKVLKEGGRPALIGVSALILFTPTALAQRIYVLELREKWGMGFGLALLLGISLTVPHWAKLGWGYVQRRRSERRDLNRMTTEKTRVCRLVDSLGPDATRLLSAAVHHGGDFSPAYASVGHDEFLEIRGRLHELGLLETSTGWRGDVYYRIPDPMMETLMLLVRDQHAKAVSEVVEGRHARHLAAHRQGHRHPDH